MAEYESEIWEVMKLVVREKSQGLDGQPYEVSIKQSPVFFSFAGTDLQQLVRAGVSASTLHSCLIKLLRKDKNAVDVKVIAKHLQAVLSSVISSEHTSCEGHDYSGQC